MEYTIIQIEDNYFQVVNSWGDIYECSKLENLVDQLQEDKVLGDMESDYLAHNGIVEFHQEFDLSRYVDEFFIQKPHLITRYLKLM